MSAAVATAGGSVRMRNHGRTFPPYLDTRHPEAIRGTARVRAVDPNLIVGMDTRDGTFQVWGPSIHFGGWVAICRCQDDTGRPMRGAVRWELVTIALIRARDGELACDLAQRETEESERRAKAEANRELEEAAKYYAKAVSGELNGWGRWSAEDVNQGYREAKGG